MTTPPAPYVVRERLLPPHIRPHAPVVYDVTEAHTTRPVAHGVHTCPDRAADHAERLGYQAERAAIIADRAEQAARAADRARIATNDERRARETAETTHAQAA